MKYYLIEVRDSDGNDCTVYDAIVAAETQDDASKRLWKELEEWYPNDESDGGFGTFHACDCACEHRKKSVCLRCSDAWECSHGGLLTNEDTAIEVYDTEDAARKEHRFYHRLIDLTEGDTP